MSNNLIGISPKRHTNHQQVYEKMLNSTNHEGNAYQTLMRYQLTFVGMALKKKG